MFGFDEDAWIEQRAFAHKFMREKEEGVIKKWLTEIGYTKKDPIGYYRNIFDKTMVIYTNHPGILIGKGGENVKILENYMNEEFLGQWKAEFVEIRGGFVTLVK